ncbi:sensor histidine kinase [Qipengyuania atrilutea]|uniref:histidine kinase n=1 Tax=Qipengyuania atrilutea TaxID=2744473 RepID=A0A850H6I2_9SPHN|nr:GAF domain-containing protein [Actirhodobacter atriluteus]NVD44785.1 PAS domain S-box protein [Actirhodobacter atriluteus]
MQADDLLPWPTGKAPDALYCEEANRLSILEQYGLDALENDPELRQITAFTAKVCGAPICLVSLVEKERQRFLVREGLEETETPRPTSFCAHAMLEPEPMIVPDAQQDPRFTGNPLVLGQPHIRFYAGAPLISHEGAPLGSLCVIDTEPRPEGLTELQVNGLIVMAASVMRRLRHRREALAQQAILQVEERRLRAIADSIPDIAFSLSREGKIDYLNQRFSEVVGDVKVEVATDWLPLIHEDEHEGMYAAWKAAYKALQPFESEFRLKTRSGEWRWNVVRILPSDAEDGKENRWFGTITDIHDSHSESENRQLLARELSHRIKNIFAVISGLISMRVRKHPELAEFAADLNAMIRSLGHAHDYVNPLNENAGHSLHELLTDMLAPYGAKGENKLRIDGDARQRIGERAATPLALIFHELATNSAKYGALSHADGYVQIDVSSATNEAQDGDADRLKIRWSEPGIAPPADESSEREGFGSRLLRMSVQNQLGGEMTRTFDTDGLTVDLDFPAQSISG